MESMVVFFPCKDLKETREFYENIIGLSFYMDQGSCYIFDSGKGYLGFTFNKEKVADNHPCISFNLKDNHEVDLMYEKMLSYQVKGLTKPVKSAKYPVYSFFLEDPNGYTVEFQKIEQGV